MLAVEKYTEAVIKYGKYVIASCYYRIREGALYRFCLDLCFCLFHTLVVEILKGRLAIEINFNFGFFF